MFESVFRLLITIICIVSWVSDPSLFDFFNPSSESQTQIFPDIIIFLSYGMFVSFLIVDDVIDSLRNDEDDKIEILF